MSPCVIEVPDAKKPYANLAVMGAMVAGYIVSVRAAPWASGGAASGGIGALVLRDASWGGLVGHIWLHDSAWAMLGSLVFFWFFGAAVCRRVGNLLYLLIVLLTGMAGGAAHLVEGGGPAIGASGALAGTVGAYIMLLPTARLVYGRRPADGEKPRRTRGLWLLAPWVVFEVATLAALPMGLRPGARACGFLAGLVLCALLLLSGLVRLGPKETSLLQFLGVPIVAYEVRTRRGRRRRANLPRVAAAARAPAPGAPPGARDSHAPPPRPSDRGLIRWHCRCGQTMTAAVEYAGTLTHCPRCRRTVRIPSE